MKFRTEVPITSREPIAFDNKLLFLGSCFSENVGRQLLNGGMNVTVNPFGTLFHPIAIANALESKKPVVFERDGKYFSWLMGTKRNGNDAHEFEQEVSTLLKTVQEEVTQIDYLFLTFGSAYAYVHKEKEMVVANCHKVPQIHFDKVLMTVEEMTLRYEAMLSSIFKSNPSLKVVLTVSPVIHVRDGLLENSRSKARLIELAHTLAESFENVSYFPAYELVRDDLRDYRFYGEDLVHPSVQAVNYVLEYFKKVYFTEEQQGKLKLAERATNYVNHRVQGGTLDKEKLKQLIRKIGDKYLEQNLNDMSAQR